MVSSFQGITYGSPDAKAVIRGFGSTAHFDGIFVNNVLVCLSIASLVAHVPAKGFKKRIDKFNPQPSFIVIMRTICIAITVKALNQFKNFFGCSHPSLLNPFLK